MIATATTPVATQAVAPAMTLKTAERKTIWEGFIPNTDASSESFTFLCEDS
jgi:hypothetical protein